MSFEHQLDAAHRELASKGVWYANYNPPLFRQLRRLGLEVRPPHYLGWLTNLLIWGSTVGSIWGLLMWFFGWQPQVSLAFALRQTSVFAISFGLLMAIAFWVRRQQLKLTPWEQLPSSTPRTRKRWQPR